MSDTINTNEVVEEVVETPVEEPVDVIEESTSEVPSEEVTKKLPDEYTTKFSLSYTQYLAGQKKDTITEEECKTLLDSVVSYYENDASVTDVRNFFEIPVEQEQLIDFRCYNITAKIVSNQSDYNILLTTLTLKFGQRAVDILNYKPAEKVIDISNDVVDTVVEEVPETPDVTVSDNVVAVEEARRYDHLDDELVDTISEEVSETSNKTEVSDQ